MIQLLAKAALLVAISIGSTLVDTACPAPDAPAGHNFACNLFVASGPHVEGNNMAGAIRVTCDPEPVSHRLEIWFEVEIGEGGGQWIIQGEITRDYRRPDAAGFTTVAQTYCKASPKRLKNWRIMARAMGDGPIGADGKSAPFKFKLPDWDTRPAKLPCG